MRPHDKEDHRLVLNPRTLNLEVPSSLPGSNHVQDDEMMANIITKSGSQSGSVRTLPSLY